MRIGVYFGKNLRNFENVSFIGWLDQDELDYYFQNHTLGYAKRERDGLILYFTP